MTQLPITTETGAKDSIFKITRAYLETYHKNDLAMFLPVFEPYMDIPLKDFGNSDKKLRTTFMVTHASANVADIAIQALGTVWMQLLNGNIPCAGQTVYMHIHQRVFDLSRNAQLADQMAHFFRDKFENREL